MVLIFSAVMELAIDTQSTISELIKVTVDLGTMYWLRSLQKKKANFFYRRLDKTHIDHYYDSKLKQVEQRRIHQKSWMCQCLNLSPLALVYKLDQPSQLQTYRDACCELYLDETGESHLK